MTKSLDTDIQRVNISEMIQNDELHSQKTRDIKVTTKSFKTNFISDLNDAEYLVQ